MAIDFEIVMGYKRLKNYSIRSKSHLQQSRKDGCEGEISTLHSRSLRMRSFKVVEFGFKNWQDIHTCISGLFEKKLFWCPVINYCLKGR